MGRGRVKGRDDSEELDALKRELMKGRNRRDFKEMSNLHNRIGILYREMLRYEEALEEHEEEANLTRKHFPNDLLGLGVALRAKGEVYLEMKQERQALPLVKEYLRLSVAVGDLVEQQRAHVTLGRVYLSLGLRHADDEGHEEEKRMNLNRAEREFLTAKDLVNNERTQVSNTESMEMRCGVFINLYLVLDCAGRLDESLTYLRKAVEIAESFALHDLLFRAHLSFYEVHLRLKEFDQAVTSAQAAVKTAKALKDPKLQADAALLQAKANFLQNDVEGGVSLLKRIRKDKRKLTFVEDELEPLLRAGVRITRTEDKLHSCPDGRRKAKLYEILGDKYVDLGNFLQATVNYEKALETLQRNSIVDDTKKAALLFSLAETLNDMGKYDDAKKVYLAELQLHERTNPSEAFKTQGKIALLLEKGDFPEEEILDAYRSALNFAKATDNPTKELEALNNFATFLKSRNRIRELEKVDHDAETLREQNPNAEEDSQKTEDGNHSDSGSSIDLSRLTSDEGESDDPDETAPVAAVVTAAKKKFRINEKGETPLHVAAKKGDLKSVCRLLRQGHDVNPRDSAGWIPLHEAANFGNYTVVKELLEHGARIDDQPFGPTCDKISPLHDSAANGHVDVVDLFIDHGANVLLKDANGNYPLDSLLIYYFRTKDDMTPDQKEKVKRTLDSLKTKMAAKGKIYSKEQERRAKRKANEGDDESRAQPSFLVDRRAMIKVCLDDYDPDDGHGAVDFYSKTMRGLRGNAKENSIDIEDGVEENEPAHALIAEHEYVDEDWLDDDLLLNRGRSKRKRSSPEMSPRRNDRRSDHVTEVTVLEESRRKSSRTKSSTFVGPKRPSRIQMIPSESDDETNETIHIPDLESDAESTSVLEVTPQPSRRSPSPTTSRRVSRQEQSTSKLLTVFSRPDVRVTDTEFLSNSLQYQFSLTEINLSGALIFDEGLKSLKGILPTLKSLVTLDLSMNGLTREGLNHLREGYTVKKTSPSLQSFNLSYNPLGQEAGHALTELLGLFDKLKKLSLADTDLCSSDFENTSLSALLANLQLEELDIRWNHVGEQGVNVLVDSGVFRCMQFFNGKKYDAAFAYS